MAADPKPASFENTARRTPHKITVPMDPPATADPENASVKINAITLGMA